MNGEASWYTAAVLLFGVIGLGTLVAIAKSYQAQLRAVRRRVACPRGRQCDCVLLQRPSDGKWVDVASCAAFEDPERVTCEKRCLPMVPALT